MYWVQECNLHIFLYMSSLMTHSFRLQKLRILNCLPNNVQKSPCCHLCWKVIRRKKFSDCYKSSLRKICDCEHCIMRWKLFLDGLLVAHILFQLFSGKNSIFVIAVFIIRRSCKTSKTVTDFFEYIWVFSYFRNFSFSICNII